MPDEPLSMNNARETKLLESGRKVLCVWRPPSAGPAAENCHHEVELHYIKRGQGFYFIGRRKYPFANNHLVVIRSSEMHNAVSGATQVEKGSLFFSPSFLDQGGELDAVTGKCPRVMALAEKEATLTEVIFRSIAHETENRPPLWEKVVRSEISLLLLLIRRAAARGKKPAHKNPLTGKIIACLEKDFSRDISAGDIAARFYLSASRLDHVFREETGLTIRKYLLQRRIIEAKKLLCAHPGLKVSAVAARAGFRNFAVFNRSFKKVTGLTAANYRRTCGA